MTKRLVEFRSYKLKPGTGTEFHRLVLTHSVPLLQEFKMDLVAHGQSVHDPDAYYLIRTYDDLDHLTASQDELYTSDAWRKGPREAIVSLIEQDFNAVLWLTKEAIDGMRV